jgi:hypothetical protein
MLSEDPKLAQQELLDSFKKEHGEYPAWNAAKKPQQNSKPAPAKVPKTRRANKTAKSAAPQKPAA